MADVEAIRLYKIERVNDKNANRIHQHTVVI